MKGFAKSALFALSVIALATACESKKTESTSMTDSTSMMSTDTSASSMSTDTTMMAPESSTMTSTTMATDTMMK